MKSAKTTLILLGIIIAMSVYSYGTDYNLSNPLFPSVNSLPEQSIGGYLGIGPNWQSGTHFVDCEGCEFLDGTATGFTIGGLYQRKFGGNFYWGGKVSLDLMNIKSSYIEREQVEITNSDLNKKSKFVPIDFRYTAELNLTYLGFAPFLAYNPVGWLSLRGAPKISFPVYSRIVHSKELTSNNITINGVEGQIKGGEPDIQESEFPDLTSPLIGADMSLFLNTTPSHNTTLSLGYIHYIPFMTTSSFGEDFAINSWRFVVEFKYTLKEAYDSRPKSVK